MKPDTVFKLEEIHYFKKSTVAWFVAGLSRAARKKEPTSLSTKGTGPSVISFLQSMMKFEFEIIERKNKSMS